MQIGIAGLGKMGKRMAQRLAHGGHQVIVYNRTTEKALDLANSENNIEAATTFESFAKKLNTPRTALSMVPAGGPTDKFISAFIDVFDKGDIIIDGANSNYKDTLRHAKTVTENGFHFLDVGVSGGVWGLKEGYSLMIGGESEIVEHLKPIFETLAPGKDKGWGHVGPHGAGHFVKMVHNGIEYGMMQAYAEGFEILNAKKELQLDLHQISEIWRYGTVIRSWLLDLTANALSEDQTLESVQGWVNDSGEGRWTVLESIAQDVPAPVITMALLMRLVSRQEQSYAFKLLASMRNQFGGHEIKKMESVD
ncbi:MAG: 6-phosphogluconate dehydrogenase (decarboxylating) [Anaerolineaceae bacterium]|nr:6-phosphogluconate dehydrogenase (decarboxylating) [Anaerolineaceae bacterium]